VLVLGARCLAYHRSPAGRFSEQKRQSELYFFSFKLLYSIGECSNKMENRRRVSGK